MAPKRPRRGGKNSPKKPKTSGKSTAGPTAEGDGSLADTSPEAEKMRNVLRLMVKDLVKEKQHLNEFQQEDQSVEAFWTLEKKRLQDLKMELRNKVRQKEDLQERHQYELKVYKQKVKHLLHEQQAHTTDVLTVAEISLKQEQDQHREDQADLTDDKRSVLQSAKEKDVCHVEIVRELRLRQEREVHEMRTEFQRKAEQMRLDFEEKMRVVRRQRQESTRAEINAIEQRKNTHIGHLMQRHKQAFLEIKNFYAEITHNNLDLIKSRKIEVQELQKQERAKEKAMLEIAQVNRKLSEPFKQHLKDVGSLKMKLKHYERDKKLLDATKSRTHGVEEHIQNLDWEHEVLKQKFQMISDEHAQIQGKLEATIYDVQQKSSFHSLILEKKLTALAEDLEKKETALHEVLTSMNMRPTVVGNVSKKLEDVLMAKNSQLKELEAELNKVKDQYYNTVHLYETTMRNYDVPLEELGFVPAVV